MPMKQPELLIDGAVYTCFFCQRILMARGCCNHQCCDFFYNIHKENAVNKVDFDKQIISLKKKLPT